MLGIKSCQKSETSYCKIDVQNQIVWFPYYSLIWWVSRSYSISSLILSKLPIIHGSRPELETNRTRLWSFRNWIIGEKVFLPAYSTTKNIFSSKLKIQCRSHNIHTYCIDSDTVFHISKSPRTFSLQYLLHFMWLWIEVFYLLCIIFQENNTI